jgi:hypothetical protein
MQGVDRHDQLRGRFSLADGHSFKKWYKKLALAMIDIARVNAFCTRQLAVKSKSRDANRQFVTSLVRDLISGEWQNAPSCEGDEMLFGDDGADGTCQHVNNSAHIPVIRKSPGSAFVPIEHHLYSDEFSASVSHKPEGESLYRLSFRGPNANTADRLLHSA